ncbi:MAG: sigma-54 interaction domain-containing protein [Myxococcota bacterium]
MTTTIDPTETRPWQHLSRRIVHAPDSPLVPILDGLERMAESRANVLVLGECGSGKEAVVRALHELAPWSGGPFVPLNIAAIPENLLESELFGHVRGAFTGADRARQGRLELANDGTLFLDEIGEMPAHLQVKLLRVLQEMEFVPVGATKERQATFRLVAATNRDLEEAVADGDFRQDLYFRLDVVRIEVPPLRERPMDVAPLARHFLRVHGERHGSNVEGFSDAALDLMRRHTWPGNVRELENLVQGILVLKREGRIEASDVERRLRVRLGDTVSGADSSLTLPEDGLDLREAVEEMERNLIRQALRRSEGNKSRAANLLRLNRTTLVEKIKRNPVLADV